MEGQKDSVILSKSKKEGSWSSHSVIQPLYMYERQIIKQVSAVRITDVKQACQGNTNLSERVKKPLWQPVLAVIKNFSTSTKKVETMLLLHTKFLICSRDAFSLPLSLHPP